MTITKPKFHNIDRWADYHAIGLEKFSPYHYRLDGRLDVWVTTRKCRFVDGGDTKEYDGFDDLLDILRW